MKLVVLILLLPTVIPVVRAGLLMSRFDSDQVFGYDETSGAFIRKRKMAGGVSAIPTTDYSDFNRFN